MAAREAEGSARGGLHQRPTEGTCVSAAGEHTGLVASRAVHAWRRRRRGPDPVRCTVICGECLCREHD
jgi:hypothetical protein